MNPKAFLDTYILKGLQEREELGDEEKQRLFEEYLKLERDPETIRFDPNELDLREFRNPGVPVGPSEFLERDRFLLTSPRSPLAQSPSFDINRGGDARRARKGLTPIDVKRLMEANPDFADDIRRMYLPGPTLPPNKLSSIFSPYESPSGSFVISPKAAEALASIEYMGRGRTPDFNPAVARDTIGRRASEIMRGV